MFVQLYTTNKIKLILINTYGFSDSVLLLSGTAQYRFLVKVTLANCNPNIPVNQVNDVKIAIYIFRFIEL